MKIPRKLFTLSVVMIVGAGLTYAFWPRPLMVDSGEVVRRQMLVTITAEGRTQVRDLYLVSTPVTGKLLRVSVKPGDQVVAGESLLGQMQPSSPTPLDVRAKAQARANFSAAKAALRIAKAERERAIADGELANTQLQRMRHLILTDSISQLELDNAIHKALISSAALRDAEAAIALREAELAGARALLIGAEDDGVTRDGVANNRPEAADPEALISIYAPTTGRVLQVIQESEATLPAGTPIVKIGDVENNLEVVVELLSSDAVQVSPGYPAVLLGWGGYDPLRGVVERIEPWGFTKVSALGIEEQRVNTLIRFTDPPEALTRLGHGFRVEAQIVIWEDQDALVVPSSALFRDGPYWAVFVVANNIATLRRVEIGRDNGLEAQVLDGLKPAEQVVLFPSPELTDGARVSKRKIQ